LIIEGAPKRTEISNQWWTQTQFPELAMQSEQPTFYVGTSNLQGKMGGGVSAKGEYAEKKWQFGNSDLYILFLQDDAQVDLKPPSLVVISDCLRYSTGTFNPYTLSMPIHRPIR
jgi:hypothetical protein